MHAELASKLRLTALALGSTTHKDLCARFRAVNPATPCDLDRLHKWIQGRALPRSPQLYDDWAKVLGTKHPGTWIAACTVDAFVDEISALFGISIAELRSREALRPRSGGTNGAAKSLGGTRILCGAFACYSHAWAPRYRGKLIRGALRIQPGKGPALQASYRETLLSGMVQMVGDVTVAEGVVYAQLREPATGVVPLLTLIQPGPPASVLCGILSGQAIIAHDSLPSATRMLVVRVPDDARLDLSNRYLDLERSSVCRDLRALGLSISDPERLDAFAAEYFGRGLDQVSPANQADFANILDAEYFPREDKRHLRAAPTSIAS